MKHIPRKSWQYRCSVSILLSIGQETCIVKTHRSAQLFLYCSGGKRSVKCVCPALEVEASKEEQRGVVRFLVAEGAVTCEFIVACLLCMANTVCSWQCGQAHRAITPDVIAQIDGLIRENRWITEEQIRVQIGISHGTVHPIIKDHLQIRKICNSGFYINWQRDKRLTEWLHVLSHLQQYYEEEYAFLSCIITGDETWCHHFEPETKQQRQQWKHLYSPLPKKSKLSIWVQ